MGRLKDEVLGADPSSISRVRDARTYTLIQRGPVWYVNFRIDGRQHRISTMLSDFEAAKALVEAHRPFDLPEAVNRTPAEIERMMERARARARKRGLPFSLGRSDMQALIARCKGRCEVSGHPLEKTGPFRPSLDRIDCTKGYTPDNVRIVCLITNTAMLHYGEAAFLQLAAATCRNRNLV